MTFEEWFEDQYFYTNMRFRHGESLFFKDGDVYRKLPVQMAYMAWKSSHMVNGKDEQIELLISSWRGFKIKGIAPEHKAYMGALNKCAAELEKALRGGHDET